MIIKINCGFNIYCIHICVISLNTINRLRKARIRNQNQNRRKHYPPLLLLLVVSLHQSDPLSDTFFCDIVVNHEIIKRACLSQQRALEEMLHRLMSFFTITRGVILICIFPLSKVVFAASHFRAESVQASPFSPCAKCITCKTLTWGLW